MKVPLRFQITEFDCGSVSLLNCLSYLYEREEIPALLIKQIYKYTLDCYDENGNLGNAGTSREAVNKLTRWITHYANSSDFDILCERLTGNAVSLEKMATCLADGGVILVRCWQTVEHYVIITKIKRGKLYIFDPYYLDKTYYARDRQIKIVFNQPFTHNRVVSIKRFFAETHQDFALGPVDNRECVLIRRHTRHNAR